VGLNPNDKRSFKKYSLGMKQRLGIAAALMEKPDLLILDEPTNALDEQGVAMIAQLIRKECQRGALVVVACHDADFVQSVSDVVIQIQEGRVTSVIGK
jgi:ABC-2 type transport system ATP-binding protein